MQPVSQDSYIRSPFPLRVAGPEDAPFVSALIGQDATDYMSRVTTLVSGHGFFFLEPITPSILEAHMQFDKPGRGKEALYAARAGLRYAFDTLNAMVVFGRIPLEDRPARMFARLIGLRSVGEREGKEWFEIRKDETCRLRLH